MTIFIIEIKLELDEMKILIVSPFFLPDTSVAVVRISSLARTLIKDGHDLTIIRNEYRKDNNSLSKNELELINLKSFKVDINESTNFIEASKRYKNIFRKVMQNESFDLVLITAGPYYTIPLCKISKQEFKTKCIIDYRDLWIFDIRKKTEFLKPLNLIKKIIYFPMEKVNIKHADLVVTVTEEWKDILSKVYRTNKVRLISNGYDDGLLQGLPEIEKYPYKGKFVIGVFGKLSYYSVEYGTLFFKAMKQLLKKYPDLLILHIGEAEKQTEEAIKLSGFDGNKYINTGFIGYSQGIQLLKKSSVNVVIDIRKGAMGTKFYDYIFVNKPLVYLGKKNTQLDHLIKQLENGFTCYSEESVIDAISKIKEEEINLLTNRTDVNNYSRSKQNKKYLELISKLHVEK